MKRFIFVLICILFNIGLGMAQSMKVSGSVFDELGDPVIGASIQVKGTSTGAISDLDGKFQLTVPTPKSTLVISFVGYQSQEVKAAPNLKIVLKEDAFMLEGVVVTGMQKMDKRLFTGATTKLDAAKTKLDGMADMSRALEGRAAGVSVQNVSGTFGSAPKIRVRGATSIYGNSRPLWVVDGIVMEDAVDISSDDLASGNAETLIASAIAGLNADDIESIQVLKDGSATSIYGARAMAGVVVVTTKKGTVGVSRLSYTGELTYRMLPSYNQFNILNSQEQMGIYQEMERKGWLEIANISQEPNSGVYGKMYELIGQRDGDSYGIINNVFAKNAFLRRSEFMNTDWFNLLFNNNVMQNHSVSISSGSEKAKFYLSLSAMNDPGWTKSSSVERYTINANGSYNILNNLTLNIMGNGSYRKQKAPGTLGQETDMVSGDVKREFDINPYSYAMNTSRTLDPNLFYRRNYTDFNILHELDNNYIDLNVVDVKFQGELNWKIRKGWEANVVGAIKAQSSSQEHHVKDHSNQAEAYRAGVAEGKEDATIRDLNPYLYTDPDNPSALPVSVMPKGGIYNRTSYGLRGLDFRATTTYNTSFNDTHIMNLFGGMEVNSLERTKNWFRGWGYEYDKGGTPFYDYMIFKQGKEENSDYYTNVITKSRNVAFFGSGTYSYKGRYILNGTFRYEGSNKLGKARSARWLPTWNVAGARNLHEESWFQNSVLSRAMLKSSYSLTADSGPSFVTNSQAVFISKTPWRPSSSVIESGLTLKDTENSQLTYEKKHEFNVGVDLGFLNDRIGVVADYYMRRNFDLIGQVYTPGVGGIISKYANVASMKSDGIEFSLSTKNIVTRDFAWETDFIFSKATNKITDLASRSRMIELITGEGFAQNGYPVRALFSIPFAGLNDEGLPTFINEKGQKTISDIYFQENRNLGFLKYEGPTDPTITGSFGNMLRWKGFNLNIFMTYSFGNVVRLDPVFKYKYTDLTSMPKEFKNRWMKPGDEQYTDVPVIASRRQNENVTNLQYAYNAYNYSSVRVAKGDFIRMKEVSLVYNFPKNWIGTKINTLSAKVQATNLFLIYADKKLNGQDPEFFNSGGVASPVPRQFTFTLRLSL